MSTVFTLTNIVIVVGIAFGAFYVRIFYRHYKQTKQRDKAKLLRVYLVGGLVSLALFFTLHFTLAPRIQISPPQLAPGDAILNNSDNKIEGAVR